MEMPWANATVSYGGAGRKASWGDAVVVSIFAPCASREHFVHVVATPLSGVEGALGPLNIALASMREGERRQVGADEILLEQVCTPRGWSLSREPFGHSRRGEALEQVFEAKAKVLKEHGVVALCGRDEGGLTAQEVAVLRDATDDFVAKALNAMGRTLQEDPSTIIRFSDVVARTSHRLNVKPPRLWDTPACNILGPRAGFRDVLRHAFGTSDFQLTHCGALMARPAPDGLPNNINQAWHRDSPRESAASAYADPYAVVVYIPLVDMYPDNGATEFLLGSHRDGTDAAHLRTAEPPEARLVSTSGLRAGDVVIFDCRTCHRGLLHTSPRRGRGEMGLRPVLALNCGIRAWVDEENANNWGAQPLVPGPSGR